MFSSFRRALKYLFTAIGASLVLSACVSNEELSGKLLNMEYGIEVTGSGRAVLKDGIYEESAAAGSAMKVTVRLESWRALGDVNGDGTSDAAVILKAESGGSGTFFYLAVVLNISGISQTLDAVFIGDRISIQTVEISDSKVEVVFLDRNTGESMSTAPSVRKSLFFRVVNGELIHL